MPANLTDRSLRQQMWRPRSTPELLTGLGLALMLPWFAAWLSIDLAIFERFVGLPFLVATVAATLVGRLAASLVATLASGALIVTLEVLPAWRLSSPHPEDLIAVVIFVVVSLVVAYTLALKDAANDEAGEAAAEVESLARALAAERNTIRQIVHQMPNGVVVLDAAGALSIQNERAHDLLMFRPEPGLRLESDDVPWTARDTDGRPREPASYPIIRSLRTGEVVIGEQMVIERSDGSTVTIEVDSAPIHANGDGTIIGAVASFQDVTERSEIQTSLIRATTRLRQLQAVTDATLTGLGFDDLAERLMQTLRRVLQTDSATLLLLDREGSTLVEHSTVGASTAGSQPSIPIGTGIAGKIASTVSPLVVDDLSTYEVARSWLTEMHSLMGVPLVFREQTRGVIHVASRTPRRFTSDDVEVLELAASRIASALERATLYDSRTAMSHALQRSLAPTSMPHIEGVDLAAAYLPFSEDDQIGGDFYAVFPHGDTSWGIVIGDVSGKGPDAAAIMGLAAHTVRATARYESRPAAVLLALNETLLGAEHVTAERFCTACEMRLRSDPGGLHVTVCLAGHPMPFVIRSDGSVQRVGEPGTLLGTFSDPTLHDVTTQLSDGDTIVAFTDGLVEQRRVGIDEGERRLAMLLSTCAGYSSEEIVRRIENELLPSVALDDDVAIVVIGRPR